MNKKEKAKKLMAMAVEIQKYESLAHFHKVDGNEEEARFFFSKAEKLRIKFKNEKID